MWLTYSFLVAWIGGGLILLAMLALRTERRPYPLALAMVGYGVCGFLCTGFGFAPRLPAAVVAAIVSGALGYALLQLFRPPPGLPIDIAR